MKVLVTGATGYLGRHILEQLHGRHEAVGLARRLPASSPFRHVQGDVLDPDSLARAAEGCDAVLHAAGVVSHKPEAAARCYDVHVHGTQNVLAAALQAGARRFVNISSSGTMAVGPEPVFYDEAHPCPIQNIAEFPYYRSKRFAEDLAIAANQPGFEVLSLNPSLLLGPGDPTGDATRPVLLFLQGRIHGAPSGGVSFADVRDVAEAAVTALRRGAPGERYLLTAANWTFKEFYDRLARLTGLTAPAFALPRATGKVLRWLPELGKQGFGALAPASRSELIVSSQFWYCKTDKAQAALGWAPRDPAATLLDTVRGIDAAPRWATLPG